MEISSSKLRLMKPIEYVGAAPMKKKRRSSLGGWLLVAFAIIVGGIFVRPLVPYLQAQQNLTSDANVREAVSNLHSDGDFSSLLAAAALERTQNEVAYDGSYFKIDFPNGDIRMDRGKAEDLVVRSYRTVGIDLQVDIHEDIKVNFHSYPQVYHAKEPDTNIDHRRVKNLQRFFSRKGQALASTTDPEDYAVGDIVIWKLLDGGKHIGLVVPGPGAKKTEPWVVHNIGNGPVWENKLFDYPIDGHYRYEKK
ncbi:MAG: hypothetical protein ACJAQT_002128 [Akkermansiaceae bacterium]|jgi:uncharacterized protein YijF (DUF1287 family)